MATRRWTDEEKNKLVVLAKQGKTMDELVVELDRSRDAIAKYLSKMDIRLSTSNKWTRERTQQFKEDWLNNNISKKKLLNKYNKTWK